MIPFAADQSGGRSCCAARTGEVFLITSGGMEAPLLLRRDFGEFVDGLF